MSRVASLFNSNPNTLRYSVSKFLKVIGVNAACRYITRDQPRIIMFHKIYPDSEADSHSEYISSSNFNEIVRYLSKHYRLFTLKNLILYHNKFGVFPKNSVVLTFDDGFSSILEYAFPVLEKYNVPATIFVCPQLIDEASTIWPELIFDSFERNLLINQTRSNIPGLLMELKGLSRSQREIKLDEMIGRSYQYRHELSGVNRRLLSWKELQYLSSSGLIEVGSHTLTHSILSNENNEGAREEVFLSKKRIEQELDIEVFSFCYPNGQQYDFGKRDVELLKESGYECAVTAVFGLPDSQTDSYTLPRFGGCFQSFYQAVKYIDGVEYIQRRCMGKFYE